MHQVEAFRHATVPSTIMEMPFMIEWVASAQTEPDEVEELDVEF